MNIRLTIVLMLLCISSSYAQQQNLPKNYGLKIGLSPYLLAANYENGLAKF